MTKDFPVFDGDSHVVEPSALWAKYLEPEYSALGNTRSGVRRAGPARI